MSESTEKQKVALSQGDVLTGLMADLPAGELLTVAMRHKTDTQDLCIYCALIPNDGIDRALANQGWDLTQGNGLPGFAQTWQADGTESIQYLRFGTSDGIEPLIHYRDSYGMGEPYYELSEEFRHFNRLHYDAKRNVYMRWDGAGAITDVAILEPKHVRIRLKEIRQFLAAKGMHLAVFFDCHQHAQAPLDELGLDDDFEVIRKPLATYGLGYGADMKDGHAFSVLQGKRLIPGYELAACGAWPFNEAEPRQAIDFILDVDEQGREICHTSDPERLRNGFGANPDAADYLTPVHFRKGVLDKYYAQTSKYSVEDGYLRCGELWGIQIDNHHGDCVVAWLGDLGRDLPSDEQYHWRSHNIPPAGGISATFFRRQLMAGFAETDRLDLLFKQEYAKLGELAQKRLGYPLLLPLDAADEHYFASLRVPAQDEQKDFDEVVLGLTKILIDSLNEKELNKHIKKEELEALKGSISRLEKVLTSRGLNGFEPHIKFLRNLQDLRSSGAAHRKGGNYKKVAKTFELDSRTLRDVFKGILASALDLLLFLAGAVESGIFDPATAPVAVPAAPASK